jgi:hypothetical protein
MLLTQDMPSLKQSFSKTLIDKQVQAQIKSLKYLILNHLHWMEERTLNSLMVFMNQEKTLLMTKLKKFRKE